MTEYNNTKVSVRLTISKLLGIYNDLRIIKLYCIKSGTYRGNYVSRGFFFTLVYFFILFSDWTPKFAVTAWRTKNVDCNNLSMIFRVSKILKIPKENV